MKVALIGQKGIPASWGGVENHVDYLSQHLNKLNVQVLAYARSYYVSKRAAQEYMAIHSNVRVVFLPSIRTKHLDAISHTFLATLHAIKENVDVYHFHSVGPSLLSFLPRVLRPHAKVVTTFHSPDRLHRKWGKFAQFFLTLGERTAFLFANKTIVVSKDLQNYCHEQYARHPVYIPNGVPTVEPVRASQIEAQFGLEANEYILTVARLVPHKGIHYLIEAFKKLQTQKKLVIVGDSTHTDEYVAQLKELAKGDERIVFTGYQTGKVLQELFSNCFLYVQPSESEGLSVSVLEAGSYGRGVLVSDIPANVEIVESRGFVFRNTDVADLEEQLRKILANPAGVEEMGKDLRKHVQNVYNWEKIAQSVVAVYESSQAEASAVLKPTSAPATTK